MFTFPTRQNFLRDSEVHRIRIIQIPGIKIFEREISKFQYLLIFLRRVDNLRKDSWRKGSVKRDTAPPPPKSVKRSRRPWRIHEIPIAIGSRADNGSPFFSFAPLMSFRANAPLPPSFLPLFTFLPLSPAKKWIRLETSAIFYSRVFFLTLKYKSRRYL